MKVKILEDSDLSAYENFIMNHPEGGFFYSSKYKKFIEKITNAESCYYSVQSSDGKFLAIYPLMRKWGIWGYVYNSLPFYGSHGGCLDIDVDARNLLLNEVNLLSVNENTVVNMMVSNLFRDNSYSFKYQITDSRIGQVTFMNFKGDSNIEQELMEFLPSKTRNIIRKAIKSNVEVYIDNNDFDFIREVHNENMIKIGGKPKSDEYFSNIKSIFIPENDYLIFIAKKDGVKVAGLLLFLYMDVVEYFTPVVRESYRTYNPLSLIIFKAMALLHQRGFRKWNWGGTWHTQSGVYHFKKSFSATDLEYKYYINVNNKNIFNSTKQEILENYDNFYLIPFSMLRA